MVAAILMGKLAIIVAQILILSMVASAYTNHTVGDSSGWFFNLTTNTSSSDFSKWASTQTFNLGDFLIFNTNTNQTVILTYNETAYQICNADDTSDTDTFVYSGGNQIGQALALTLTVPLTKQGLNYFFSDGDDGVQCEQGMAFKILVNHGQGLPPSLNQPPPPPYIQPPPSDSPPSSTVPNTQQETFYNRGFRSGAAHILHIGLLALTFVRFILLL